MDTKQYTTIDKSDWPRGPWDEEPDKVQWQDPATGLPCLIDRKDHTGIFCGYVGVPESHPWHGKAYDAACELEAHGGVNFADHCDPRATESSGVCHVPGPDESDRVWWFGFDCGHAWDVMPAPSVYSLMLADTHYRDLAYVRDQVTQLAAQLVKVRS